MIPRRASILVIGLFLPCSLGQVGLRAADEPKPTPENTISIQLAAPVKPQTFSRPVKFFVHDVIDRTGDPQPMLLIEGRGGVFLDREPRVTFREALENCLKEAGLLAPSESSADLVLTMYLFHFGPVIGVSSDLYSKVDLYAVVNSPRSGKSEQVLALGTSIVEGIPIRKKAIMEKLERSLRDALAPALQNFLRGNKLRQAVDSLSAPSPQP
jgi:hypothetical protein